jgi:hypothetical protein
MPSARGASVAFVFLGIAVVLIAVLFVFPGFLSATAHCESSYSPSANVSSRWFCAEPVTLVNPTCGGNFTGGFGPTTYASFFGYAFSANLTRCCAPYCPSGFPHLQVQVLEPNGSSYGFAGAHWLPGLAPLNWTTPDGLAGIQWSEKFNLTFLVAYPSGS